MSFDDTIENIINEKVNNYIDGLDEDDIPLYKIHNKSRLVLSGGGVLGIAHIGAIKALEECGIMEQINTIVCTSVGAIIGGLYIAGYDANSLYKISKNINFSEYKKLNILNLFDEYGLDSGKNIEYLLKRLIKEKGYDENINLLDFYNRTKKTFVVTSVSLKNNKTNYISHSNFPKLELYKAIRMSISIPIIYTPVQYENDFYIDGGCRDNFPIQYVKDNLDDTIGIYISNNMKQEDISSIDKFISATAKSIKSGLDSFVDDYKDKIINIDIPDISSIEFSIDIKKKIKLFEEGYKITKKNLSLY